MAGQLINLTRSVTTLTPTGALALTWQNATDALDITGFPGQRFDFSCRVYVISGTTPSATVKLYTSMYSDAPESTWHEIASFTPVTTSNTVEIASVTAETLRYVRWRVSWTPTDVDLITFEILGVAW